MATFTYTFEDLTDSNVDWTYSSPTAGSVVLAVGGGNGSWHFDTNETVSVGVGPFNGETIEGTTAGYIFTEMSGQTAGDVWIMEWDNTLDAAANDYTFEFNWCARGTEASPIITVETNENGAGWVVRLLTGDINNTGDETIPDTSAVTGDTPWHNKQVDLTSLISNANTLLRIRIQCDTDPASSAQFWHNDIGIDSITIEETAIDDGAITASLSFAFSESPDISAGPLVTDVDGDEDIEDAQTGVVITGTEFGASQGTGTVEISDNATYGSGNVVLQDETAWGDTSITITVALGAMAPGSPRYVWVTIDAGTRNSVGFQVTMHRAKAFAMSASTTPSDIPAGGSNTTGQLTAPTAGSFFGGRIQDDENPADAVDPGDGQYLEDEWCIEAIPAAVEGETYQFRVLVGGVVQDTYTVTPELTLDEGGDITASITYGFSESPVLNGIGELTESIAVDFSESPLLNGLGELSESVTLAFSESPDLNGLGELAESITLAFSESPFIGAINSRSSSISYGFTETPLLNGLGEMTESITVTFSESPDLTFTTTLPFLPFFIRITNILLRM